MTGREETENNICILYEAANQTPVYEVYQKLCKFRGNHDIDYVDVEQKYYRFYHGNSEEESAKSISSKRFSDLPMDILKLAIDKLELIDKLCLRKVSKSLRSVVDGRKIENSDVYIRLGRDASQMYLGEQCLEYSDENGKSTYGLVTVSYNDDGVEKKWNKTPRVIEGEHWEHMIRESSTILGIPDWKFAYISWGFDLHADEDKLTSPDIRQKQIQLIENMMKKTPLQVKTLAIQSTEHAAVMAILPYVIPGSLKHLRLDSTRNGAKLEEVVELEQWKGLKSTCVNAVPDSFPIEHFFHMEEFTIDKITISEDRLVKIRDILFKSAKFSFCSLTSEIEDQEDQVDENGHDLFRALVILINRVMGEHPEYNADTRRYSIPDSDEHFTVKPRECYIGVELEIKRQKNGQGDIGEDSFDELPEGRFGL